MEKRTRNAEIILKEKAEKAEANNSKFCYGLNMTPLTEAERKQREEKWENGVYKESDYRGLLGERTPYMFKRVDKNTVPDGWYAYDIRHGDEGDFCTLEKRVFVNHAGTFLCQQPVKLDVFENPHDGFLNLAGWGYTFE